MISVRRRLFSYRLVNARSCASGKQWCYRRVSSTNAGVSSPEAVNSTEGHTYVRAATIVAVSLSVGFAAGRYTAPDEDIDKKHQHVLPNGLPRTCCDSNYPPVLTEKQFQLPAKLKKIVGPENVLDGRTLDTKTVGYLKGARLGFGPALCIVTPRKLHHVQEVVQQAVDANCIVLPQGQNTGLTGGSVPHCKNDDRPAVVVSMKYLDAIFPLDGGKRVVCLAGVGLASVCTTFY